MAGSSISVEQPEPGLAVVALHGEHEAYGARKLEQELDALLEQDASIVIDLSQTTFVDSSSLLVLLRMRRLAGERGRVLVLQMNESTGHYVRRTFEVTRLTSVFTTCVTRAEALEAAGALVARAEPGAEPA